MDRSIVSSLPEEHVAVGGCREEVVAFRVPREDGESCPFGRAAMAAIPGHGVEGARHRLLHQVPEEDPATLGARNNVGVVVREARVHLELLVAMTPVLREQLPGGPVQQRRTVVQKARQEALPVVRQRHRGDGRLAEGVRGDLARPDVEGAHRAVDGSGDDLAVAHGDGGHAVLEVAQHLDGLGALRPAVPRPHGRVKARREEHAVAARLAPEGAGIHVRGVVAPELAQRAAR
mmetsp:Transcript_3657/g.9503  ORF Transcript_3657/g.9503 Transcript_3657/m.9503 type:complete len:233 (-) Transcript_3657:250-948(-)